MKRALTKQACDVCSRKKRQCSGETPCQRCKRAGVQCTYSVKAAGRARPTEALGKQRHPATKSKVQPAAPTAAPGLPPLSVSPSTGLQGLQESKFLSVFLEHCAPIYPVADDASIRDGLMHEFVGLVNKNSQRSLRGPEAMRGQALSCSLFSCIAIGGLMAGCPTAAVAPHMSTAQASLSKFGGLSDVYAVRAFVLYAMASEFLGGLGPGTEYRKGMEAARAVFEKLPPKEKEPVLSAVLSHFMVLEGLPLLQHVETNASAGGGGGGGGGSGSGGSTSIGGGAAGGGAGSGNRTVAAARERNSGTSYVCCTTAHEEATFQKALATRADVSLVAAPHPPPAYVVADATLLTIRFSRDRGDVATRLWHLHDFATSELRRFRQEGKGAVAILALMNPLMGVKIRLGRLDGMLEAAELASSLLQTCPGLVRIYHAHVAHVSMAVYRLYGRREAYDSLKELFARTIDQEMPPFEDIRPRTRFCDLPVCAMHLEKLLKMEAPRPGGGGSSSCVSAGGTAGAWSMGAGGLLESAAAGRGGGGGGDGGGNGAVAGVGTAAGGAAGGALVGEQDGPQAAAAAAAMAGRRSRRRIAAGGDSSGFGFASPSSFPGPSSFSSSSPRDQMLLASGSYSPAAAAAATDGANGAIPFTRPELSTSVPGWIYPDRRLASQPLLPPPPPSAPRNQLPPPLKTSPSFDGLAQPVSAGPPTGLGMALGTVFGSTPAARGFLEGYGMAGARREQAVLGYSEEGVQQQPASQEGGGIGGPDGADMAATAWAGGGHVQNQNYRGGEGGWEDVARGGGADMVEGAQQHRSLEYSGVPVPAASSMPAVFTSTVCVDTTAHHHEQRRGYAITAADFRGVNYDMLGVADDSGPGDPPPPAPDL